MPEATALSSAYPLMAQNSYLAKASRDRGPFGILTPSYGLQGTDQAQGGVSSSLGAAPPMVSVPGYPGGGQVPTNFISNNAPAYRNALQDQQNTKAAASMVAPIEVLGQAALGGVLLLACLLNGNAY